MHHRDNSDRQTTNVFGAVIVAGLVGALAGLLLAPKRGAETRQEIRRKVDDMKNKTQDKAMEAQDKFTDGIDTAKGKIHDATAKSKDLVDKVADKTKRTIDKSEDQTTDWADEIQKESAKRGRPTL